MLLISILLPVLGAVALFIWRPRDVRACHALTMTATPRHLRLCRVVRAPPGAHPITLLELSCMLTVSFKLDGSAARLWRAGGLPVPLSTCTLLWVHGPRGRGEPLLRGFYLLSYAVTLGITFAET